MMSIGTILGPIAFVVLSVIAIANVVWSVRIGQPVAHALFLAAFFSAFSAFLLPDTILQSQYVIPVLAGVWLIGGLAAWITHRSKLKRDALYARFLAEDADARQLSSNREGALLRAEDARRDAKAEDGFVSAIDEELEKRFAAWRKQAN